MAGTVPAAAVDGYVAGELGRLRVPGAVLAIVEGGQVVHVRGFGRARPGGEAPTEHTPFFIGSLTKSFTAVAVMQLVEAGVIDLDAPVQRYLPWFRVADADASARITVRHLLHQTSGLPEWAGLVVLADGDARPDATGRQVRALAASDLAHEVGTTFEYCNANYNALGLVVEAASGERYADLVQRRILDPLGMRHTFTSPERAREHGLAVGHRYWFGVPVAARGLPVAHGSLPAGMLVSTAADLARYLIAHLDAGRSGEEPLLSRAGFEDVHRGAAEARAMGVDVGRYAMGWFSSEVAGQRALWHSGTLPDYAAHMAFLPGQDRGVVLLCNANHHLMVPVFIELGMALTEILAGEQPGPGRLRASAWVPALMRAPLLLPAVQAVGVAATLRALGRGGRGRPASARRARVTPLILPLAANLLAALPLVPVLGRRRGYLMLYMPDVARIAVACGVFALVWGVVRSWLALRASEAEASPR